MVRDDPVHNQTPEQIRRDFIVVSKNSYFTVQRKKNSLACLLKPKRINLLDLRNGHLG
jgi:hypothetical protein